LRAADEVVLRFVLVLRLLKFLVGIEIDSWLAGGCVSAPACMLCASAMVTGGRPWRSRSSARCGNVPAAHVHRRFQGAG
jgi:hypothetical protein